jgi:dihydroflavonol-4-reductase
MMTERERQADDRTPVLVIGASGFLGSHVCRALVQQGERVRAMLRPSSNSAGLQGLDLELCHGDVEDPPSLLAAMQGCAVVYYCVVDTRSWLKDSAPLYRVNVIGLDNAMDAAQQAGIQRFVFTSSIATIGRNPSGTASEEDAFNWGDVAPDYIRFRVEAEQRLLRRCREQGFPAVACCVANTYGPGDVQPTPHGRMLMLAGLGRMPVALDCASPCVDIRDAAQAMLLAACKGRIGERYIISAEHLHQRDLYGWAAAAGGQRAPRIAPLWLAYTIAWINQSVAAVAGRSTQLCVSSVRLSHIFNRLDSSKAQRELGWSFRPVRESVVDAVAWYRANMPAPSSDA